MQKLQNTIIIIAFFLISGVVAYGQQPTDSLTEKTTRRDARPLLQRIRLGGSTGFWINTRQTHVEVAPMIAYDFPRILTTGLGYRYIYTRDRFYGKNLNTYGPNIFARAQLTRRIYLWTEWEYLKTEYAYELASSEITTRTDYIDSYFAGAGYIRQLGKKGRGGLSIQVLYNFEYDREDHSPYYSPVIYRVGYFF